MTRSERPPSAYADTNVFIALFAAEGHPLHDRALDLFRRVADGTLTLIVTPIVVSELVYTTASVLRWTRRETADRITALLQADGLIVPELEVLTRTLDVYARRRRLDFADAFLAAAALEVGPASVASFDRDLQSMEGIQNVAR